LSALKSEIWISKIIISTAESPIRILQDRNKIIPQLAKLLEPSSESGIINNFKIRPKIPTIYISDFRLIVDNDPDNKRFVILNTKFYPRVKNLICEGDVDLSNLNINLNIMGKIPITILSKKIGFYIDVVPFEENLLLSSSRILIENVKMIGSGIIYNFMKEPYLDIKLISNPLNLKESIKLKSQYCLVGLLNLTNRLYGKIKSPKLDTEAALLNSYIYSFKKAFRMGDIACNIRLGKEGVNIKGFTAVFDDRFPFFLSGTIKNLFEPKFDIEIVSTLRKPVIRNIAENFDLHLNLSVGKDEQFVNGEVGLSFIREERRDKKYFSKKIEVKFDDLSLNIYSQNSHKKKDSLDFLRISAKKLKISEKLSSQNEATIKDVLEFNNLRWDIIFDPGFLTIREFNCYGYGGEIRAYGTLDFTKPFIYNLSLVLNNIEIEEIKRFYPINCSLSGRMNGRLLFQNKGPDYIKGIVGIKNAQLRDLEPLDQTADFLGINSIKHIEEANILTEFESDKDGFYINKLDLNALGIILKSNLNINKKHWIDGRISLSLSRNFLEESDKFRLLLKLAQEESSMIDFDFRATGFPGSLRIQLLEGEFRDKLMGKLNRDIQRRIEVEINKVINSLEDENLE